MAAPHFLAATHPVAKTNPHATPCGAQRAGNVLRGDNHAPAGRLQAGFQPGPAYPLRGFTGVEVVGQQDFSCRDAVDDHPMILVKPEEITFDADQDWVPLADHRVHDTL